MLPSSSSPSARTFPSRGWFAAPSRRFSPGIGQHQSDQLSPRLRAARPPNVWPDDAAMSIERRFDVSLVAQMALREKQIQQNYRPIIAVHKWFARRPGTLFRGLILAEFGKDPLADAFFRPNDFSGLRIADPFMGGGTPLVEANRVGCDVDGFDVNPMSAWIVREEIEHLDISEYRQAADNLITALRAEIDLYYRTRCPLYGEENVPVKSFLWVKVLDCEACGVSFDLFPGYLLAENRRHPRNVLVCPACGDLNEVEDRKRPGSCTTCGDTTPTGRPRSAQAMRLPPLRAHQLLSRPSGPTARPPPLRDRVLQRREEVRAPRPLLQEARRGRSRPCIRCRGTLGANGCLFRPRTAHPCRRRNGSPASLGVFPLPRDVQSAPAPRSGIELPADCRG